MSENIYQPLLQAMIASKTGSSNQYILEELMTQMGIDDPNVKMVAEYISQQEEEPEEEMEEAFEDDFDLYVSEDEDELWREDDLGDLPNGYSSHLPRLPPQVRHELQMLKAELVELRHRNETLASALGACHYCWGEDDDCPACLGRAPAGTYIPDSTLFSEIVLPAIRRYRGR